MDPQIEAALLGNLSTAQGLQAAPYVPYTGQQVAPLNAAQTAAGSAITGLAANDPGAAALKSAVGTTQGVAGFTPQQVSGSSYNPTGMTAASAGPAAMSTAAQIDPNAIQDVAAHNITDADIAQYMNPYTQQVIDTTNADLLRTKKIQDVANAATATQAGAFGGSGSAVQEGMNYDSYLRATATEDAALRSSGYSAALAAAQQQAAQALIAAQANQGTHLAAGTTDAGFTQATGATNAAATNQRSEYDASNAQQTALAIKTAQDQAAASKAAMEQAAATSNQSAGIAGAGLRLNAGAQLGTLSNEQVAQPLSLASAAMGVGNQQQATTQAQDTANYNAYLQQQQWPLLMQELVNQSLGLMGNPVLGQSQSTSSGNSNSSAFNMNLSSLAGLVPGA